MMKVFKLITLLTVLSFCAIANDNDDEAKAIADASFCFWTLQDVYMDSLLIDNVLLRNHDFIFMKDGQYLQGRNDTVLLALKYTLSSDNKKLYINSDDVASNNSILYTYDIVFENKWILVLSKILTDFDGQKHVVEYRYYKDPLVLSRFVKPSQN